ncbi:MAG: ATP phosphoribosyltransferase regulatory subunit [Ktedonobacteraceae bacterium]
MKKRIERLRGMHDLSSEEYLQQRWVVDRLSSFLAQAGYSSVDAPILEQSDLFLNSFGQELWQKLYAFRLHHRDLCLRPEYTASICRLYLDHYQQHSLPLRLQYAGPIFRYEAPGRGRYRQYTQLGVELLGGHGASADAEILQLACGVLDELHIAQYRVELGHIGIASGFINRLHLDNHTARLLLSLVEQVSRSDEGAQVAQARLTALYPMNTAGGEAADSASPERALGAETRLIGSLLNSIQIPFDPTAHQEIVERFLWKVGRREQGQQILHALEFLRALQAISGTPPAVFDEVHALLERYGLDPVAVAELEQLVATMEQCGVPSDKIAVNLSLGRGVNYYTGLVFEIHAEGEDGFDAQLCGGGRYDHLIRAIGGPRNTNACGFAFGVERLLSLLPKGDLPTVPITQALVIPVSVRDNPYALQVARSVRACGVRTEVDVTGHGVGAGLKLALKKQIRLALIVGEDEQRTGRITLRDLLTREEQVLDIEQLAGSVLKKEQCV